MKDSGLHFILRSLLDSKTKTQAQGFLEQCSDEYLPIAKEVLARFKFNRTTNQNALLHKYFSQIADHYGDRTLADVKGECHHRWGLNIRLQDEQFAWVWSQTGAKLSYEKQCSLLASETLGISSRMSTKELKGYIDEMVAFYRRKGVPLTNPEDRK